jgi:hypothetical protein
MPNFAPFFLRLLLTCFFIANVDACPRFQEPRINFKGITTEEQFNEYFMKQLFREMEQQQRDFFDCKDREIVRLPLGEERYQAELRLGREGDEFEADFDRFLKAADKAGKAHLALIAAQPIKGAYDAARDAGRFASDKTCLRLSTTQPGPGVLPEYFESYFTITNECSEPVVAFYCLVTSNEPDPDSAANQRDCRLNAGQRVVSFGDRIIYTYAPKSVAEFQKRTDERLTIPAGVTWESHEVASGANSYRAKIFVASCNLGSYLSGACKPDAIKYWQKLGRPTS